jgi:hypothetical protein
LKAEVKLSLSLTKYHTRKIYGAVEVWLHMPLTLALDGGEMSTSHSSHFTSRERAPKYPVDRRMGGTQSLSPCPDRPYLDMVTRRKIPCPARN